MNSPSHYRADIDGLRAFAVIAVILFHLKIPGWTGGFVGVDIFFVLSGFLITSIILREIKEGTFLLSHFWERRARRIIPAMVLVTISTLIASYFITLYPPDFKAFGLTVSAQSVFMANIYFMRQVEYFAAPPDTIPLLHTWSLGVEEQFYIVFPLLVIVLTLISRRLLVYTLALCAIASFAYSVYLVNINPSTSFNLPFLPHLWGGASNQSAGFYFLPARAWELLVGALTAIVGIKIYSKKQAVALSSIGFIGIITSFFIISEESQFPGYIALMPVLGTVLLIIAHTHVQTFISQLLSFRLFVWTGLISYSLYLWHWPIIVLSQQIWAETLPKYWGLGVVVLTFILSVVSYHLVETPFRKKRLLKSRWILFTVTAAILSTLFIVGVYIYKADGLPSRTPESARAIALAATDFNPRRDECFKNNLTKVLSGGPPCTMGIPHEDGRVDFVLWGDSQADALMPTFEQIANEEKLYGVFFAVGGCAPLVGSIQITTDKGCNTLKEQVVEYVRKNDVQTVFLASAWKANYENVFTEEDNTLQALLTNTVEHLAGQKIVIIENVPIHENYEARDAFYKAIKTGFNYQKFPVDVHLRHNALVLNDIKHVVEQMKNTVSTLNPAEALCDKQYCNFIKNEKIFYRDKSHLSLYGAAQLKESIKGSLEEEQ